jgi:orotate phosphoribosyltransferase
MPASSPADLTARALLEAGAFLIRPAQPFRLTSGLLAPFYINCRQIIFHPAARARIAEALVARLRRDLTPEALDVIAGGVTAGVPFATLVADRLGRPLVYVRPEPKEHGTAAQIEGGAVVGRRVVLIEDLITTAGSILKFVGALRAAGAMVEHVAVVFSRAGGAAEQALAEAGVTLHALCTLDTLIEAAHAQGTLSAAGLEEARAFLADPEGWSKKREAVG